MALASVVCMPQHLRTLNHTDASAQAVDTILLISGRVCVAYGDLAANEEGSYIYEASELEVPTAAVTIVAGETAYWDNGAQLFTNVVGTNTKCGMFRKAAASGDAIASMELVNSVNL